MVVFEKKLRNPLAMWFSASTGRWPCGYSHPKCMGIGECQLLYAWSPKHPFLNSRKNIHHQFRSFAAVPAVWPDHHVLYFVLGISFSASIDLRLCKTGTNPARPTRRVSSVPQQSEMH